MQQLQITGQAHERRLSVSSRDLLAVAFRQKRRIAIVFSGILLGTILYTVFAPPQYEADMKILVKHARQDPVLTSDPRLAPTIVKNEITEEDLNSEIELIKGQDLLQQVVVACGLDARNSSFISRLLRLDSNERRLTKAVHRLERDLGAQPVKKSNLINVSYRSSDPTLAASVLSRLSTLYLAKHLAVHRPPGEYDFFKNQAEHYKQELQLAEARLSDFSRNNGTISAQSDRDYANQKSNDAAFALRDTYSSIRQVQERIHSLEAQAGATSARIITADKNENAQLLSQLKANLLTLQLKRTELLTKYDPEYPPVQELEQQISQLSAAIAAEQSTPLREITTDRNPTAQLINDELTRARAERASLVAKAGSINRMLGQYRADSERLYQLSLAQQNLLREAKSAEDNFQLYRSRSEEARIADDLDQKRMVNVAVAVSPTVPDEPQHSGLFFLLIGTILAFVVSLGSALMMDSLDQHFRTPDELEIYLNLPLLAAMPKEQKQLHSPSSRLIT
jgi:uncharacterized protein involved in exopolysaccharide biosynthesis